MNVDYASMKRAIEEWESDEDDSISTKSRDAMVNQVSETLKNIPGVRKVVHVTGSLGSDYFELHLNHDDAYTVKVRVSNHEKLSGNHDPPAWSFGPKDTDGDYVRGFAAISKTVKEEIDDAIYRAEN